MSAACPVGAYSWKCGMSDLGFAETVVLRDQLRQRWPERAA
jgi:hypothetical protein